LPPDPGWDIIFLRDDPHLITINNLDGLIMQVHFLHPLDQEQQQLLFSDLNVDISLTSGEIQPEHHRARILVAGRPTRQDLENLPDLEYIFIPWTGVPEETRAVLAQFPELQVHNLHHNAAPVAELALSLLLATAKQTIAFDHSLRSGNWQPRYLNRESILLAGKKALLLGFGELGKRIKQGLEGLGIDVMVIKRTISAAEDFIYPPDQLLDLLPRADILILALPLTDQTEDLIGPKELDLLPSSAILVNVSRGKIVNQAALYAALKERRIFGAGLDVWYNYPGDEEARDFTLPGDFPFQELENLVMSPHRGGLVRETEKLRMKDLARLINAAVLGDAVPNRVDLDRGY
jgi:phosphoglycerate dehydrogenase-like enzyme